MSKEGDLKAQQEEIEAKKAKINRQARRAIDDKVETNKLQQQLNDLVEDQIRLQKRILEAQDPSNLQDLLDIENAKLQTVQDQSIALEKQSGIFKEQAKLQENTNKLADGFASRLGISKSVILESAIGFKDQFKALRGVHEEAGKTVPSMSAIADMAQGLGGSFAMALNPLNIIESLMGAIFKASLEFFTRTSAAMAQFAATAGDLGTASKAVGQAMDLSLGVNIEHAAKAASGLAASFTEFTSVSLPLQKRIIRTSAALERVGISASVSGEQLTYFTQAAGMSLPKAEKQMKQLAVSAASFGKTPGQFASEFVSASKTLASHGPNMMKVFLDLESVAKASGIAMEGLLQIAGRFDTFDSAASSVGNLNALMGGDYLNTLEMMNMTEKERIEALKRSLEMNGKSFDQMERFERKAIAESMGTDEKTLAQMMGYSTRESRKARREAEAKSKQEERYNKMIRKTIDVAETLSNLFQSIFVQTGLVEAFGNAFKVFTDALAPDQPLGETIRTITGELGQMMAYVIELGVDSFIKWVDNGEGVIEWLRDATLSIGDFIESLSGGGAVGDTPATAMEGWQGGLTSGVSGFTSFITGPTLNPVREALKDLILDPVGDALLKIGTLMKEKAEKADWTSPLQKMFLNTAGDITTSFGEGIKDMDMGKAVEEELQAQQPEVDRSYEAAGQSSGANYVSGTELGMSQMPEVAVTSADAFTGAFASAAGVHSFSTVFRDIGEFIVEGFERGTEGFTEVIDPLIVATERWTKALKEAGKAAGEIKAPELAGAGAGGGGVVPGSLTIDLGGDKLADYVYDVVEKKFQELA